MILFKILGFLAALFFIYVLIGSMTVRLHYALAKRCPDWTFLSWVNDQWDLTFPNEKYLAIWPWYYFRLVFWSLGAFIRAVVRISGVSNLDYNSGSGDTVTK